MSAHTPGPWYVSSLYETDVHGPSGLIADANNEANARLIAAAPDLYDAIRNSDDAHWTPAMRAAIAKAESAS